MFQLRLLILSVCLDTGEARSNPKTHAPSPAATRLVCCDRLIILSERSLHGHRSREETVRKRTLAKAGVEQTVRFFSRMQSKACT